jgi:hypothetical protein
MNQTSNGHGSNHTSNGMNGASRLSPPLPLMAKSLRGSRSRKEKAGSQHDPVAALPPIDATKPPARSPRAAKRVEADADQASEQQAIPADVAELISFAQTFPAQGEGSGTPEPLAKAVRAARTVSDPASEAAVEAAAQPSGAPRQNFREAYRESFRKALESYRENARQQEPDEAFAPVAPAPKKAGRSRFYPGPAAVGAKQKPQTASPWIVAPQTVAPQIVAPQTVPPQTVAPAAPEISAPAQPDESPLPVTAAPSLRDRLGSSLRSALGRTAGLAAAPVRGLRSAWSWYQGRRVLQTSTRRMRVAETISLGEKRFLAVVEVDGCQFLVGGGASSVAVLAQLGAQQTARDLMHRAAEAQA